MIALTVKYLLETGLDSSFLQTGKRYQTYYRDAKKQTNQKTISYKTDPFKHNNKRTNSLETLVCLRIEREKES